MVTTNFPEGKSFWWLETENNCTTNHRETDEDLIEQDVDHFAEKDTDLGKTNTIKKGIDTHNHPPIQFKLYRTPFAKHPIVDKEVNDMLIANITCLSRSQDRFITTAQLISNGTSTPKEG